MGISFLGWDTEGNAWDSDVLEHGEALGCLWTLLTQSSALNLPFKLASYLWETQSTGLSGGVTLSFMP